MNAVGFHHSFVAFGTDKRRNGQLGFSGGYFYKGNLRCSFADNVAFLCNFREVDLFVSEKTGGRRAADRPSHYSST